MTTLSCHPERFDISCNFDLPPSMPLKTGIRLDVFCLFLRLTTINPRKTKRDVQKINRLDQNMRRESDPDKKDRLKDKLIQFTQMVLTKRQTIELSHMSIILQTYPYVSTKSRNGAIKWVSEDAVSKAREIRIKRANTINSWCKLSKHG